MGSPSPQGYFEADKAIWMIHGTWLIEILITTAIGLHAF